MKKNSGAIAVTAIALSCLTTPASAAIGPERASAHCAMNFDALELGTPESAARTSRIRFTIACPTGVAWRVAVRTESGCQGPIALRMDDATILVKLLTPAGTPWCDGSDGTDVITGVGLGTPQTFFATALVQLAPSNALAAGRHYGSIAFTLSSSTS